MAAENKYKMSKERLEEIKAELNYLETVREKEVSELIKEARSFGDLSENSEYDEAKTEQGKLYSKIAELRALVENAEVIEKVDVAHDAVNIGSSVLLLDMTEKVEETYKIVGSQEANPIYGRISEESPLGRVLMGSHEGDEVTFEAPVGTMRFKILSVKYA